MKKKFLVSFVIAAIFSTAAYGQNDWKDRMMSEKIAFLTMETGMTPEEAQAFWPVYNEVNKELNDAVVNVFKNYKALEDAVNAGKDASKLLDNYLAALEKQRSVESKAAAKYRKVLPENKVAKLYIGEEKFRRNQIRRLQGGPGAMMR